MDNDLCLRFTSQEVFLLFTGATAEKMAFLQKQSTVGKACQFVDAENSATKIVAATDPS